MVFLSFQGRKGEGKRYQEKNGNVSPGPPVRDNLAIGAPGRALYRQMAMVDPLYE